MKSFFHNQLWQRCSPQFKAILLSTAEQVLVNTDFLLVSPGTFLSVPASGAWREKVGGRARAGGGSGTRRPECSGELWHLSARHAAVVEMCLLPRGVHPTWTCIRGRFWGLIWCLRGVAVVGGGGWKTVGFILSVWKQILKTFPSRSSLSETYGQFSSRVIY